MRRTVFRVVLVDGGYVAACVVERPGEPERATPVNGAPVCPTKAAAERWLTEWVNGRAA